jgi:hypothetical protein
MSAKLASLYDPNKSDPSRRDEFFDRDDLKTVRDHVKNRENLPVIAPYFGCRTNLFFGFFFDGTRNNYARSLKDADETFTNVARLYDAYPGQSVKGVLPVSTECPDKDKYNNFFRVYVPGVGTPFDRIDDTGKGFVDGMGGNATALWGERRIIWALVQAINCLHRFFIKDADLIDSKRALALSREIRLGWDYLKAKPNLHFATDSQGYNKQVLKELLLELHAAIKNHIPDPKTNRPKTIDPGKVEQIFISAFGFSRGAAEARVFTNWFIELCRLDAEICGKPGLTLGSFPVTFDFLGLFDTVASVGFASTCLFADGHAAWADSEVSLRIPQDVQRCLHLVAAHEVRRSFPLDSIHIKEYLPTKCEEIVFPGVHSDVGGGYMPKEQGRGGDGKGADMLSRIPLAVMYRAARLAGVPLKLETASTEVQAKFKIKPTLIQAFNAYLAQCKMTSGSLLDIMREQREHYILWRKLLLGKLNSLPSTTHSSPEDRADLLSADAELAEDILNFERWCSGKAEPLFTPSLDPRHLHEWLIISKFWKNSAPHPDIQNLFRDHVHDSFAWFKILGPEAAEFKAKMQQLVSVKIKTDKWNTANPTRPMPKVLSPEQEKWVDMYLKTGEYPQALTGQREPKFIGAGYLRFRKIYAGGDEAQRPKNEPAVHKRQGSLTGAAKVAS